MPRFLIDEDLPRYLATKMLAVGMNAIDSGDVGLHGKKDPEIFAYAQKHGLVLVTGDNGFANLIQYPPGTHHGIVVTQFPNEIPAPRMCETVVAVLKTLSAAEITGKLILIEPARVRVRERPIP